MKKTSTKLLAIVMVVALLTGVISFMTFAADNTTPLGYSASRVVKKDTTGIANIKDFDSSSVKTEYVVSDLEGLNKLAALVTGGTTLEGVTVYQTANISGKGLGTDGANAPFAGIGKDLNKIFAGTYDGQGYYVNDLTVKNTASNMVGFFNSAKGTIRNVVLGDNFIVDTTKSQVGGLVGAVRPGATPAVIDNCYIAATVTAGGSLCGGVVGQADYDGAKDPNATIKITNVTFNGKATIAGGRAGGILGRAAAVNLEMDNCVVAGTLLTGTAETPKATADADGTGLKKVSSFGGFVGETTKAADKISIKNCVNVANITSGYAAAAFVGSLPKNSGATIVNCTNYGTITNTVASGTTVKVGEADFVMEYHSALVGFVKNEGVTLVIGEDSKNLVGQTAPAFEKVSFKPAVVVVGGYSAAAVVKKDTTGLPNIKDYDDTDKKTEYVLNDMEGLQTLAYHVNNAGVTFKDITIYQTANIIGGGIEDATSTFTGIGKDANKIFSGTYDGQGYVVDNFLINGATPSGFFKTANGTIRNVVLGDKLLVKGANKTGGLIGEVRALPDSPAVVENCYVAATVEATGKLTGGVIGQADYNLEKGENAKLIMKNVTFNGKMTSGGGRAAGLLGRSAACSVEIDSCVVAGTLLSGTADAPAATAVINTEKVNSPDLKQISSCAGFIGETTKGADCILIKDSVNLATITSGYAGVAFLGLLPAGAGATIENCYNFGVVTSTVANNTPIKVADKDEAGNAIERDFLMKYHSTLVGYIYNTNANLVIDANSADKAGEKAPEFEKVDFSTIVPPVQETTTPEATTPAETTAAETTAAETTAKDTTAADTTAKDTTAAETTAKAPEETTGTNAGTEKGCGSVVGGTIALIVSVACGAMLIARKKED